MIYLGIAAGIFGLDFVLKRYFDRKLTMDSKQEILHGKVILNKLYNRGAALNILEKHPNILLGITSGFIGGLLIKLFYEIAHRGNRVTKIGLAFVLGGALSNALDRITRHYVVDYFSFPIKKIRHIVFNIADLFIFLGALFLIIIEIIGTFRKKS